MNYLTEAQMAKQTKQVLDLLQRDGVVTRLTAMHYGIANVTARIADLRKRHGVNVICDERLDANGKRYGAWSLPKVEQPKATTAVVAPTGPQVGDRVRVQGSCFSDRIEGQIGTVRAVSPDGLAKVVLDNGYKPTRFPDVGWNILVSELIAL